MGRLVGPDLTASQAVLVACSGESNGRRDSVDQRRRITSSCHWAAPSSKTTAVANGADKA